MQATQLFDLWRAPQLAKLAIATQGPFDRPKHALLAEQGEPADTVLLVAEGEVSTRVGLSSAIYLVNRRLRRSRLSPDSPVYHYRFGRCS